VTLAAHIETRLVVHQLALRVHAQKHLRAHRSRRSSSSDRPPGITRAKRGGAVSLVRVLSTSRAPARSSVTPRAALARPTHWEHGSRSNDPLSETPRRTRRRPGPSTPFPATSPRMFARPSLVRRTCARRWSTP
jgi:hypothetical protein